MREVQLVLRRLLVFSLSLSFDCVHIDVLRSLLARRCAYELRLLNFKPFLFFLITLLVTDLVDAVCFHILLLLLKVKGSNWRHTHTFHLLVGIYLHDKKIVSGTSDWPSGVVLRALATKDSLFGWIFVVRNFT
jgi:hypothetical protein